MLDNIQIKLEQYFGLKIEREVNEQETRCKMHLLSPTGKKVATISFYRSYSCGWKHGGFEHTILDSCKEIATM